MSAKVKVICLRTAGTNCDRETAFAFSHFGADVELVHINQLIAHHKSLEDYHILAVPGGFTYGDDIESGRILANELVEKLGEDLSRFINDGKLIIGICNGFQVLVKSGILPGPSMGKGNTKFDASQKATLIHNNSGKFEDRWTYLKVGRSCIWTEGLDNVVYFPIAHAEGKFVVQDKQALKSLQENDQVAFRYCSADGKASGYPGNPNGSIDDIAGITDTTGRILGLMPHPERHFLFEQHPFWTRLPKNGCYGHGAKIFRNGVEYAEKTLL